VNSIVIPERFVGELESLTVNMNVADDPAPDVGVTEFAVEAPPVTVQVPTVFHPEFAFCSAAKR
jgi:hypothetical protein